MEKRHLKCWRILLVLMAIILPMGVHAQLSALEDGKVYHFTNKSNTNIAMAVTGCNSVYGVTANSEQASQLWYATVTADYFTLRNLATGTYLKGNGQSSFWGLAADDTASETHFDLETVGTYNVFKSEAHGGSGYAHYATSQGGGIVGWETSDASQWSITAIEKTTEEIEQFWSDAAMFIPGDNLVNSIQTALYNIFSDKACTTLNSSYASMTDDQLAADANYAALPATLQQTVKKVRDGSWEEENAVDGKEGWNNEYAKKFRVQMYEPYSIEGEITDFLRINPHNNMDNPTGIFANSMQQIFIMVEGEIADGAELWIGHINGHGQLSYYNSSYYTELNEGLNIIPYFVNGNALWINYVVHTYNSQGTDDATRFPHKLSDYKPLKIHIEGGHINGYYNAIGDYRATASATSDLWGDVDNDEDWAYYKERASLADFTLLGHRQTLQFEKDQVSTGDNGIAYHLDNISTPTKPYNNSGSYNSYTGMGLNTTNGKINIMLEAWDRIHMSELATMGVISDSQMAAMNDMYPRWTAEGQKAEIYDYTGASAIDGQTYRQFCGGIDYSEYFNHHGVALGAYHDYMSGGERNCNYHYNTLGEIIGTIATVAGHTWGPAHEIGHQHQDVINLNGQTEVTNNLYANIAVWYMGMATSRVDNNNGSLEKVLEAYYTEGNNAYTNNDWALTHLYYRLWLYYHLAGKNTQFYPRLMELCRRDPLQNGEQIQGSESLLKFYKHCCVAAGEDLTEFFRAHGYLEVMNNVSISDYQNGTYNQTQEDIDEAVAYVKSLGYEPNYTVLLINDATGETGVQHDGTTVRSLFDNSATAEYGSYLDVIAGTQSTDCTATVNEDGIVTISGGEGAMGFLIFDENGELLTFANKSTFRLSEEAKKAIMRGTATISYVTADNTVVSAELDELATYKTLLEPLMNKVEVILNAVDDTYTKLGFYKASEVEKLQAAFETAQTAMANGTGYGVAYEILYSEYTEVNENPNAKIAFNAAHTYTLTSYAYPTRNISVSDNVATVVEGATGSAAEWTFVESSTAGRYYLRNGDGNYCPTVTWGSNGGNVTTEQSGAGTYALTEIEPGLWGIIGTSQPMHASASQSYNVVGWSINEDASKWYITQANQTTVDLNTIKLEELIANTEELANNATEANEVTLQNSSSGNEYYIYSNATIAEGSLPNLWDNNTNTHIHTAWWGNTTDGANHYLRIYLGENPTIEIFKFQYVTRNNSNEEKPKQMTVAGCSTENGEYTTIATLTDLPSASVATFSSDIYVVNGYKYLRFMVDDTYRGLFDDNNHKAYSMAEFKLLNIVMKSKYSTVDIELASTAYEKIAAAQAVISADDKTEEQVTNAYSELETAYNALATAIKEVDDAELAQGERKLQALLDKTTELIDKVGTANIQGERAIDLHGKIYAHEPYTAGGTSHSDYSSAENDYNLLDGNTATFFHSNYDSNTISEETYIQVDLGEGNELSNIVFSYTTSNNNNTYPEQIDVYGGTNENGTATYGSTPIATFKSTDDSNALPENFASWTSPKITADAAYRYYKFKISNIDNRNWHTVNDIKRYFFVMSEFSMNIPAVYEVSVNAAYTDLVSEELLATTQTIVNNASSMLSMATTTEQLQTQYSTLLAAKNALSNAANNIDAIKEGLQEKIDATTELYNKMAVVTDGTTTVNSDYTYTAVDAVTLEKTATELAEAQTVMKSDGLTANDVTTAINELDVYYRQLLAWENDNVAERTELSSKIEELNTLLGTLTTTSDTETAIALQCTDANAANYIYCNAPGATNNYSGDDSGVSALLDLTEDNTPNLSTFLHTTYNGDDYSDDLDHYLCVDMGEYTLVSKFKFNYYARQNFNSNAPQSILIEGSNDGETFTELTTVSSGLPTDNSQYTSDEVGNGNNYRFLRFMVKSTVNNSKHLEHPFWAMSSFGVTTLNTTSINNEYVSPNISISTIRDGIAEKTAKQVMHDSEHLSQKNYNAAIDDLQAVIDALTIAKNYATLPVQLTTDSENPILYNILINKGSDKLLQYDEASHKVAVADFVFGNKLQGWYFTPAADGKVNILPMQADGKMLSANSYGDGAGKVVATEPATEGYGYDWSIDAISGSEWYNISILNNNTINYFSNIYGEGNLLGFYNSYNTTDGGSMFKFELADYSKSDAYCTLYNYHSSLAFESVGTGNGLGSYSNGEAYNIAYSNATTILQTTDSDDNTYTTAYNTLKSAYESLRPNEPVDGGYYVFRSANTSKNNALAYASTDNLMYHSSSKTATDASAVWKLTVVDGGYNFTNLNTGTSMKALIGNHPSPLTNTQNTSDSDDTPATVTWNELGNGQLNIKVGGTWMHSQDSQNAVVSWGNSNNVQGNNSAWYIEPVDEKAVTLDLAVSKYEWTSLHLGYAVTIPDEVKAYYSTGVDGSDVELVEITDGVIPANTGVLINAPQGNYTLEYTTTETTYDDNELIGCNHDIYVESLSNYTYYVLAIGAADKAALCYIYKEVSFDESGNMTFTANDDNGTHFKLPANKVYLPVENAANIKSFSFRVIDGATGIDGITDMEGTSQSIYDLSGRKLHEITAPGVYIVNGKKVLVNKVK